MSALPPSQMAAMRETAAAAFDPNAALENRWAAIHAQAQQVAELAAISVEKPGGALATFADLLAQANAWQRDIAARGIEDVEAMMGLGLTALTTVTARGQDASAPALALWREFYRAREAALAALRPHVEAA